MTHDMTTKQAFDTLTQALRDNQWFAWLWHCDIVMAAVDEKVDRDTANRIAAKFMKRCFDVDTKEPTGER